MDLFAQKVSISAQNRYNAPTL